MKNLFSRSNVKNLISVDDEKRIVKIDMQNFKTIKNEDPLMEYLTKVSDRAKNTTVTYEKVAENTN